MAIARALVNRPKRILADEPTAALDRDTGKQVRTLLQTFAWEEGCAVIMVTHDNRVLDAANRIVQMVDGKITANIAFPRAVFIREFLRRCPLFFSLPAHAASDLAEKLGEEHHAAGSVLLRPGAAGKKFYIIRHGNVRLEPRAHAPETRTTGEYFGEAALLEGRPHDFTTIALDAVSIYTMSRDDFLNVMATNAELAEQIRHGGHPV